MPLQRLIYTSRSRTKLRLDLVRDILEKAERNNAALDLTGFLVVFRDRFLQVLEGPAESLTAAMARILSDARHGDIEMLTWEPASARCFSDWRMKGVLIQDWEDEAKQRLFDRYGEEDGGVRVPRDPHLALALLLDVSDAYRERVPSSLRAG